MAHPPPHMERPPVLVANRGEVAVRLVRACRARGLRAVAVFVPVDAAAPHVRAADAAAPVSAYTAVPELVAAALAEGCGAVLPGYGFVSENSAAAAAFEAAGVAWCGPPPAVIDVFGVKHVARAAALAAGVPVVPGSPLVATVDEGVEWAARVGFPCLVKASAGGGGMGQLVVYGADAVPRALHAVKAQALSLFASDDVYFERYVESARHVEVQIFGNGTGNVVALGERDCSVQRRRQKVVEEGPPPCLDPAISSALRDAAVGLCAKHNYRSAGTVEFIVDAVTGDWYFLEVNTRLQVEHGVTELIAGVDIVEWMLLLACGVDVLAEGPHARAWKERGYAIEGRVYAENPAKDYAPCPGVLSEMIWPTPGVDSDTGCVVRVDSWAERGTTVSANFDPLLGKVLAWGRTRALALDAYRKALRSTVIRGVPTNVELLLQVASHPDFIAGSYTTALLDTFDVKSTTVEVVTPGLQSSLQDYPGRVGYWDIGVSPSGAMDAYAMGMANALVGNKTGACALEITVLGPTLKFHSAAVVALTGACLEAELDDGKPVQWWTPFRIEAGSVLSIGGAVETTDGSDAQRTGGKIAYLAVRGGFDAPHYLGSASTFPTGRFGGITGGFLVAGDFLPLVEGAAASSSCDESAGTRFGLSSGWSLGESLPPWLIPVYNSEEWTVAALNGPHGSADFLHSDSLLDIWTSPYKVHHAANRLGVRLIGPTPKWMRADGGSAGLHPSNLHDYTYAPGAVNFSGNTPIVLMMDGPSLGGFICPITVATSEMWKVAQARPGETIRFKQIGYDAARAGVAGMLAAWDAVRVSDRTGLNDLQNTWCPAWVETTEGVALPAIAAMLDPAAGCKAEIKVTYRMSGDEHILIEYGEIELDIAYRLRVHMLMEQLKPRPYVKELCPGVRSVLVRYDPTLMHVNKMLSTMMELEQGVLGSVKDVSVPSRTIRLPLAFDDKWCAEAQERYLRSVRPDAPYMPSNVEFVRRINGLDSVGAVQNIMTSAAYMVLGLGDVYLGAPCALPVDPRHRIVTSKYNPARTYTPEGAVGIGGSYMCIYGMDSPGGYQLCGRTLPIWDSYGSIPEANRGAPPTVPWLLRPFDRICYYAVTDDELEAMREQYRRGGLKIDIKEGIFSYKDHIAFCQDNAASIAAFDKMQQEAFSAERSRWEESGEGESNAAATHASRDSVEGENDAGIVGEAGGVSANGKVEELPPYSICVSAGVAANVWAVEVGDGDVVEAGQTIIILESMKVEIDIEAPVGGIVQRIGVTKGDNVSADKELCIIVSSQEKALSDLRLDQLRDLYKLGVLTPRVVIDSIMMIARKTTGIFVSTTAESVYTARIETIGKLRKKKYMPLYGIPYVVSDDIDVSGMPTSFGCDFSAPVAQTSAAIVRTLDEAGAILIGKTNLDQFRAGLTGTQSSFGIPENPLSAGFISGGSPGAAISVCKNLATFAVAVDSNGTSIISPVMTGVMGLKVTEGLLSLSGVSPSWPAMDCVSIMANSAPEIRAVLRVCSQAPSHLDATLRASATASQISDAFASASKAKKFLVGVPATSALHFDGEDAQQAEDSFFNAIHKLRRLGGASKDVDFSPFAKTSALFQEAPLDAARFGSLQETMSSLRPGSLLPSILETIAAPKNSTASCLANALESLRQNKRAAEMRVWSIVDVVAVPGVPRSFTVSEAVSDPATTTASLGRHVRFITAMDLCAVTLSVSGESSTPRAIVLVAPAFQENLLLAIAAKWS